MLNRISPHFKKVSIYNKLSSNFIEKKFQILFFFIMYACYIIHIYLGVLDGYATMFGWFYIFIWIMFHIINSAVLADLIAELIAIVKLPAKLKGNLKLNLMHDDNCMGYSPIGYFYLKISVMLFIIAGIQSLITSLYSETSDIIVESFVIGNYAIWIVGTIIFFYPSIILMGEMNKIKKKELDWLNLQINQYYEENILDKTINLNEEIHIFKLLDLQDRVKKIHVVPMNIGMIKQFTISFFIPFIANIGNILTWISN